jgi:NTE family protein
MTTEAHCPGTGPLSGVPPPIHILLALQGGGALGAFEVGVLEHLHNGLGVGEQIQALSGVSFGGINSAIYVANHKKDPIGALKRFWNAVAFADSPLYPRILPFVKDSFWEPWVYDLSIPAQWLALLWDRNFYRLRLDFWNMLSWIYCWDNSPLKPLLKELIDVNELNSARNPHLILTSVNIETGELTVFDNRKQRLTLDNVLASTSLPPLFKPTEIDRERYWDGALFDNSPFLTLLRSLEKDELYEVPESLRPCARSRFQAA